MRVGIGLCLDMCALPRHYHSAAPMNAVDFTVLYATTVDQVSEASCRNDLSFVAGQSTTNDEETYDDDSNTH